MPSLDDLYLLGTSLAVASNGLRPSKDAAILFARILGRAGAGALQANHTSPNVPVNQAWGQLG